MTFARKVDAKVINIVRSEGIQVASGRLTSGAVAEE